MPAAENAMKRKVAESDYQDFLGISTAPKRIKTLLPKHAASGNDLKSLNNFIASKIAASEEVTSGIQVEKRPNKDSVAGTSGVQKHCDKNSVARKSGSQKSDTRVPISKSNSGTPQVPGSLNNTEAPTPTSQNNRVSSTPTSGRGSDNRNPLARAPSSSTPRVIPTQQPAPSSTATISQDKTSRKSLMSAVPEVFGSTAAQAVPVVPVTISSPVQENNLNLLLSAVKKLVKSELSDFRVSLLREVSATVRGVVQEEVKAINESVQDLSKKQGSSVVTSVDSGYLATEAKIISQTQVDLGHGVICTMAGWKEMSCTLDESDWCSAVLLGALGESAQQFRLRTKDPNLKCFSEGFKTVAKERYHDFLIKRGHKKPTKKEVESILGKLSRKARDLNGRRNKSATTESLEVHRRYVDPATGFLVDETGTPVNEHGDQIIDGESSQEESLPEEISEDSLPDIISMPIQFLPDGAASGLHADGEDEEEKEEEDKESGKEDNGGGGGTGEGDEGKEAKSNDNQ